MTKLTRVKDLYNNGSVFYRQLREGEGTGSPYSDCVVTLKVRIELEKDGVMFTHDDPLSYDVTDTGTATYDLEQYQIPAAIRKIMKKQKRYEIIQVKLNKSSKLLDHLEDPNGIFKHEWLATNEDQ